MTSFFRKLGWLARRRNKEDQLTAELQFHLEEEAEERQAVNIAQDARWAARARTGQLGRGPREHHSRHVASGRLWSNWARTCAMARGPC